jgi:glycosyltransferase involved in cell wall biosynthesis
VKVLQINNNHRIIGGSDTVYFNTGALLTHAGHNVGWFAASGSEDLPCEDAHYFPAGIDMQRPRVSDLPRYLRNHAAGQAMRTYLDARGPFDVAHLHIYYGRLTAAILDPLRAQGIPMIQSLHEYKLACPTYSLERDGNVCEECVGGSSLNLLKNRCKGGSFLRSAVVFTEFHASRLQGDVRKIDRFICVSDFQRRLLERAGIPSSKMVTLHNFVDPDLLKPEGVPLKGDYLLYFGRIERNKGLPTLIEAARKTGLQLKIAGTGGWCEAMKEKIADLPSVEYLGFTSGNTLRQLVAEARAVVVPSEWYENCPMSVLEAKAVGTPVIGARIGGIPELVRDAEDGFLVEAGNSDELAEAMERTFTVDAQALGAAAQADIEARFSPAAHLKALMRVYQSVQPAPREV